MQDNASRWLLRLCLGCFLGLLADPVTAAAAPPELMQAYQKEFAFLQAQKRALRQRLKSLSLLHKKRIDAQQARLRQMQSKLMWQREAAEDIARQLQGTSQVQQRQDERKELLDKVMARARYALSQGGMSLASPTKAPIASSLQEVFAKGASLMHQLGQRTTHKGSFFLADGTKTNGQIIQIGGIASFGISPQGRGALAPAGAGQRKLWPQDASQTAAALAAGHTPPQLQLFLYENLSKEIPFRAEQTLVQFIHSGGLIGWVIVGLGLLAAFLLLCRCLILAWTSLGSQRLIAQVEAALQKEKRAEALAICQQSRGAGARILEQTLSHIDKDRQQLEELVAESMLKESPQIERFGAVIAVIAAIAPLLGLLGTVTGMISTFDVITQFGTGDPKLLAGGISEALITTKLGLIVAIPALLLGTLLSGRAEAILHQMEWSALRLMNLAQLQEADTTHSPKAAFVETHVASPAVSEPGSDPHHTAYLAES